MLKLSKLRYFILEHICTDCISSWSLLIFLLCLTHIQRILITRYSIALSACTFQYNIVRFLSFCFVNPKHCLYRWYYATKKRDWWAWHCRCWLENVFNVQSYLWLRLTCYLGAQARQLAISSPNKIRPLKQRFLRKTSNPAFSKSDNSFKYSSYALELMCVYISLCSNNPNNKLKRHWNRTPVFKVLVPPYHTIPKTFGLNQPIGSRNTEPTS